MPNACLGWLAWGVVLAAGAVPAAAATEPFAVLQPARFEHHVERFNGMEDENRTNAIPNAQAWAWLRANVPFFECPDAGVEELYYYRWWAFRKHLVKTPAGFVLTEFLVPVSHAGASNTISCAVGHHLDEGRWLRDPVYLDDYARFWLRGAGGKPQPHFHYYSHWFTAALYGRYLVSPDRKGMAKYLKELAADYRQWEQEKQTPEGLFWQYDVRDGMEESISGSRRERNLRPTINSYMYGNARALAAMARLSRQPALAAEFERKAADLRHLVQQKLWNPDAQFFEVRRPDGAWSQVREELGFIPWCFDLPGPGYEAAWAQLKDPRGFLAPYGITTAERRHPEFRTHGCCRCEWDGAVWPFATSQTLVALGNVLRDYAQTVVTSQDYFDAFLSYARAQHYDGRPYIGEYLDETTGQWLHGRRERSRYYNHSTFADLVITGIAGLRPRADDTLALQPLLPAGTWNWFCLDGVRYHGHDLTLLWDRDGSRYQRGAGFQVLADGKPLARSDTLASFTARLP